ncbi:hypothetical protein [Ruminococcus sp. Marseille-P6503]|uniref:hypothetical protein n=1 Tax=Ruminococcus sp. Marseille-P6503 TaxID=2364796 RepID=UPI000F537667|nr:hypothetical protein [Ruminococcus sp. Marseille-P6503]
MKIKKLLVGFTAASLAASCMAFSVSAATKLSDVVYPSEEDAEMNDAYFSIGGLPFYMGTNWQWNQGDWVSITEDGILEFSYTISEGLTLPNGGTLGSMGIVVNNLPEDNYPYDITITEAKFEAADGTVTELTSVKAITEADLSSEGGFRINIRPSEQVDETTGELVAAATPEVAGWDEEGAFSGGTLFVTIDFGSAASDDDTSSEAGGSLSETDDDSSDSDTVSANEASSETAAASKNASSSETNAASGKTDNAETGAGELVLAGIALSSAALIAAKKNK